MTLCPCGSSKEYLACCGPFINESALPDTPEKLMRSRYTAYTEGNIDYIAKTMKGPAAVDFDVEEAKSWVHHVIWQGLEVLNTEHDDKNGLVEFIAHYAHAGKKLTMHEVSIFNLEEGRWYYVDSKTTSLKTGPHSGSAKIGRNDPCPCGSQKKYKKCCGGK